MKRFLTFTLALLLALPILAACGGGGKDTPASTTAAGTAATEPATTELTDGLPEVDMNGFTFKIYHCSGTNMTWTNLTLDAAEQTGEVLNDAIYDRNRGIEERFNYKMEIQEHTSDQSIRAADIRAEVTAGDSNFDLWMTRDYEITKSLAYLRPFGDLPHVDLDARWWFPQASESFKFKGVNYAVTSYFSLSPTSRAGGFVFNEDLYAELNLPKTPYDYVRENKWTLETFLTLAKAGCADLNGDGVMDDSDRYGWGSSWKEIWARFIIGSGVGFIEKKGDEYPEYTITKDANAVDKLLHIFELFNDPNVYRNNNSNMDTAAAATIQNGTALFALGHPNNMGKNYREAEMNVGFVPCPKYDEDQDRYYSPTWAAELMILLKTFPNDRLDNVSIILEALSFDSAKPGGVMETYREVMMKGKYASNPNCSEMFDIVLDAMCFDFAVIAYEAELFNPLIKEIYASRTGNVASTLAKYAPIVQGELDKLIESIEGNAK